MLDNRSSQLISKLDNTDASVQSYDAYASSATPFGVVYSASGHQVLLRTCSLPKFAEMEEAEAFGQVSRPEKRVVIACVQKGSESHGEVAARGTSIANFASWHGLFDDDTDEVCVLTIMMPYYRFNAHRDDIILYDDTIAPDRADAPLLRRQDIAHLASAPECFLGTGGEEPDVVTRYWLESDAFSIPANRREAQTLMTISHLSAYALTLVPERIIEEGTSGISEWFEWVCGGQARCNEAMAEFLMKRARGMKSRARVDYALMLAHARNEIDEPSTRKQAVIDKIWRLIETYTDACEIWGNVLEFGAPDPTQVVKTKMRSEDGTKEIAERGYELSIGSYLAAHFRFGVPIADLFVPA